MRSAFRMAKHQPPLLRRILHQKDRFLRTGCRKKPAGRDKHGDTAGDVKIKPSSGLGDFFKALQHPIGISTRNAIKLRLKSKALAHELFQSALISPIRSGRALQIKIDNPVIRCTEERNDVLQKIGVIKFNQCSLLLPKTRVPI